LAETIEEIIADFEQDARSDLDSRWAAWPLDLSKNEVHEVVGGLLARQVSLATELARNPEIWNPHVGPLILRAMVDLYISLSWILIDPLERSRQFIAYGLGQVKLKIEHMKEAASSSQPGARGDGGISVLEEWLNIQRLDFLTEVNLGSWSGSNTRQMAEESGCLDLYRFAYTTFSEAAHSMWYHVKAFNLKPCLSPLHRHHSVPHAPLLEPSFYYVDMLSKYLDMTFELFDEKFGIPTGAISASRKLLSRLQSLTDEDSLDESSDSRAE
jgi:hypothetical protein